jgi:AraC family transcriptional regulator
VERLESVLEHIDDHPGEALEIDDLAALASISPFHFHRSLSAHLHEAVSAYVRRRTLERAARQLALEDASVTECSSAAGYSTSSAFARAFRRHFGLSPRALAARLRQRRTHYQAWLPSGGELRQMSPVTVVAIRLYGPYEDAAPAAWQALRAGLAERGVASSAGIGIVADTCELTAPGMRRFEAASPNLPAVMPGAALRRNLAGGEYWMLRFHGTQRELGLAHEAVRWSWPGTAVFRARALPALHRIDPLTDAVASARPFAAEIWLPVERIGSARSMPASCAVTDLYAAR